MNPYTHIYLYAKHHYHRSDIKEDLRQIVAHQVGVPTVSDRHTLYFVLDLVFKHIQSSYTFWGFVKQTLPEHRWCIGADEDDDLLTLYLRSCLSVLMMTEVKDLNLGDPDPDILPLAERSTPQ
jgi:hypothetical protein